MRTTVLPSASSSSSGPAVVEKRLTLLQTIFHIFKNDGLAAFFHGLGPALILVINPILQFTVRLLFHFLNFISRMKSKGNKTDFGEL